MQIVQATGGHMTAGTADPSKQMFSPHCNCPDVSLEFIASPNFLFCFY